MTPTKQQRANRRNAQKSTGPKTAGGKAKVRQNAVKHGLFARMPVLPKFESEEEWQEHLRLVLAELQPVGHLESALATRIATLLWRLQRVARYEGSASGHVIEHIDNQLQMEWLCRGELRGTLTDYHKAAQAAAEEEEALGVLDEIAEAPDARYVRGGLSALEWMARRFGPTDLFGLMANPNLPEADREWFAENEEQGPLVEPPTAAFCRRIVDALAARKGVESSSLLDAARKVRAAQRDRLVAERDAYRRILERQQESQLLPPGYELQKVQRQEAHLDRALERAYARLEKLQTRRQWQAAPPSETQQAGAKKGSGGSGDGSGRPAR